MVGGEDCRIGALSLLLGGFTGGLRSFVTYVLILDDRLEEDNDQVLLFFVTSSAQLRTDQNWLSGI